MNAQQNHLPPNNWVEPTTSITRPGFIHRQHRRADRADAWTATAGPADRPKKPQQATEEELAYHVESTSPTGAVGRSARWARARARPATPTATGFISQPIHLDQGQQAGGGGRWPEERPHIAITAGRIRFACRPWPLRNRARGQAGGKQGCPAGLKAQHTATIHQQSVIGSRRVARRVAGLTMLEGTPGASWCDAHRRNSTSTRATWATSSALAMAEQWPLAPRGWPSRFVVGEQAQRSGTARIPGTALP